MNMKENSAYLKGLLDGVNLDKTTAEGKLIAALCELVDKMADEIDALTDKLDTASAYIEELDQDLGCVEELVYEDLACDCGCEDDIVELTTEDGKKLKFYFVGTIEYKGKNYSAFEPAEQIDGIEDDDLIIFELSGDDEETADLLPVEDEQLLDEVFEEFCRVLEEDELADEAESLEK